MSKPLRITPELTNAFYESQLDTWPLLDENTTILDEALHNVKELYFGSCLWMAEKYLLKYRRTSQTADVDKALSGGRPCFLCPDARPALQGRLEWEDYEILVNPYPLAVPHFTIPTRAHAPQLIDGRIKDMARLTRLFDECCVIYNGPRCGASAPDHFHFQAFDFNIMRNIFMALDVKEDFTVIAREGKSCAAVPPPNMCAAPYILLDIASDKELPPLFGRVVAALPPADPEPMMNIAAVKMRSRTLLAIFPRRKHRPDNYGEGPGQVLVSPATAEMLGTFVLSREKDMRYLGEKRILKLYEEVCVSGKEFAEIIGRISES